MSRQVVMDLKAEIRVLIKQILEEMVEEEKRGKGHWIWHTGNTYECSECGVWTHVDTLIKGPSYKFCPYCGANMEEDL